MMTTRRLPQSFHLNIAVLGPCGSGKSAYIVKQGIGEFQKRPVCYLSGTPVNFVVDAKRTKASGEEEEEEDDDILLSGSRFSGGYMGRVTLIRFQLPENISTRMDAALIMFDASCPASAEAVPEFEKKTREVLGNVPIVVRGNKNDKLVTPHEKRTIPFPTFSVKKDYVDGILDLPLRDLIRRALGLGRRTYIIREEKYNSI